MSVRSGLMALLAEGEKYGAQLVIPWVQLAVLVPLVAAAMAWAGIRRAPQVTRRAT